MGSTEIREISDARGADKDETFEYVIPTDGSSSFTGIP